jgi:hypothetical protein
MAKEVAQFMRETKLLLDEEGTGLPSCFRGRFA